MSVKVVLGAQWGDEGKGKLVDILCQSADLCCRAQGGNNAGHTIVHNGKTYDVHSLPSGSLSPSCQNLIGSGCVVHIESFFREIENVERSGVDTKGRIFISDRCHVVLDLHQRVDGLEEVELGKQSIGTTRRGIGPSYSTKMARSGIRMTDMLDHERLASKMRALADSFKKRFGDLLDYDVEEELARLISHKERLQPYIVDQVPLLRKSIGAKDTLVEGANALMLDIDSGTYPYVTSSNTGIGGVITGLGIPIRSISEVVGVVKAYTTRVGGGPFPTEQLNEVGEILTTVGREYGVTTGRRRRCGWLDLVVVKYSDAVNHYDSICITKLDILDEFSEIKVAVSYRDPATGQDLESFPADLSLLDRVEPVYESFAGWQTSTANAKSWDELPKEAISYLLFVEKQLGVKIKYVGVGPGRESMILREV